MGLREKVTLTLVTIALTQIACRHCMPRTPRKASLKQYLNDLKPVKNQPVPTPYSPFRVNKTPKQTFGKTPQNGRIGQNSLPKKSLYKTYNFPENEYPLDNSPRDPFSIGMNFNQNNNVNTLQKARNLQSSAINDLKKEMKMKRKLLSNKQVNNENKKLQTDMSAIKFAPRPDSIRLLESDTFPEVQYPLNTMDTWETNYWNYLPFSQEKPFSEFGQQTFNPKAKKDTKQPFTRLTKARASKYLQSYDKLKEEHRRTSTENSKRSNVGQTGLNFTKTATCERVSDDFITAGLLSHIPSHSTEIKKALTSTKITTSSENTCPVTENAYHPMPIPYKVIEDNTEYNCPTHEPKNKTEELQDVDNSEIAQTLKLIQEILLNDDTSSTVLSRNYSEEVEQNNSTSDYTVASANEDICTEMDSAKNCTQSPTEELLQEVSDDNLIGNLQNMTSPPEQLTLENTTTIASPLNFRMPLPFSDPITYETLTNALNSVPTTLSNGNAVLGSTSIIIIPFNNNAVGKSQSHMFGKSLDTPIIVHLPSTQSSDRPSQPSPFNQIVSSSLDDTVPKNLLYNVLSNMAPLQNDSPYSNVLVSELLNSYSDSESSVPMSEMLPTNSMCYNNESSPSSMREKTIPDIIIDKSLTDDALFVPTTCDEKSPGQSKETDNLNVNIDTLPPISDFEHPLFDFSDSEFTSLSHGPYNNVLHNEVPIIARDIDSDQQILNVTYKDLFTPTQNVTSEHLQKTIDMNSVSEDSLSEIPNEVPPVALDENLSSVTLTDNTEILNTNTLLTESIPNMQEHVDTLTESLPQPIDKTLFSTPFLEPSSTEPPQLKEASLLPTLLSERLSDKLPLIPVTPVLETTTEIAPQDTDGNPIMTDMTLKTELYKIRQMLDKMLSNETPAYTQPPPVDTTLLSISNSDILPMNETSHERLPVPAVYKTLLPLPATDNPIVSSQQLHETLPPMSNSDSEALLLPGNKLVTPNKLLDTDPSPLPIDENVTPTLESATSADNKPYFLDNLVTPLSETITTRTKNIPNNGLSHKMEDLPLKMDLNFPDIYAVSRDDLPLHTIDDLSTQVRPISTNDLPAQVVQTLTSHSEVPLSDLPKPTDVLSLPVDEILEGASPNVPTDSVKTLSGSFDKVLQDFPTSKVLSNGLPTPPMNVFKSSIHKTFPDGQFNEISLKGPLQKDNLPQSMQKVIPDLSFSDARTNEPSLEDNSPSLVLHKDKLPYPTEDTIDLPLVVEHLLSPGNDVTRDSLVTDMTTLAGLESTKLDNTSEEVLSLQQDILSYKVPSDYLPTPAMNVIKSTIRETFPDDQFNEISLKGPPQKDNLPQSMQNVIPDLSLSDARTNEPSLEDNSPSLVLHKDKLPYPTEDTIDLPLVVEHLLSPGNDVTRDSLVTDMTTLAGLESTKLDNTSEEVLSLQQDILSYKVPSDYLPTPAMNVIKSTIRETFSDDQFNEISLKGPPQKNNLPQSMQNVIPDLSLSDARTNEPSLEDNSPSFVLQKNNLPYPTEDTIDLPQVVEHLLSPGNDVTRDSLVTDMTTLAGLESTKLDNTSEEVLSLQQDILSYEVPSDYLPTPAMNVIKSTNRETFPDDQFNEISLKGPSQKDNLPQSMQKVIPDLSLSDARTNEPSLEDNSPSLVFHKDKLSYPIEDTIDLPLVVEDLLSPGNDVTRDSLVTDMTTLARLESTKLDNTSEEVLSLQQDILSYKVPSDYLPTPAMNVIKSTIHETFPDDQFNEISLKGPPQKDNLPQSMQKVIPDLSLSDARTNEPSLEDNSPSLVFHKDKLPYPIEDTIDLPLVVEHLLSPRTDESPDSLVSDISNVVPLSTNLEGIEPIKLDNTSDKVLSESPLSELPRDDLPLPQDSMLPLSNNTLNNLSIPNNKTPSNSKLKITKVLLENILSDITKEGLSSLITKALPATPHSQLDEALHNVDIKFPLPETKEIPLQPVEKIFSNSEHTEYLFDYVPFSEKPVHGSITGVPSEFPLPLDKVPKDKPYIPTDDVEDNNKNKTESLGNPTHYLPVPNDKVSLSKSTTKTTSSKLPITKVLLESVLSDITAKGFSVPVGLSHTVTSPLVLDKTRYNIESPISQIIEDSPSLPEDKILSNTLLSDHPTDNLSISIEDTFPLPIEKTFSELQSLEIPTESTSSIDNVRPNIPNISMFNKERAESENSSSEKLTNDLSTSPMEGMLSKATPSDLTLPKNKTSKSSKLPIAKALLKNVLSDINTRGFSMPVTRAFSVTPRSQLDKTLYVMDSPAEKSSVIPNDNLPLSGTNENVSPRPTDKTLPNNSVLDIPTDLLLTDKIRYPDILTDNIEQEDKSDVLTNDVGQEDKPDMLTYDVQQEDKSGVSTDDVGQENKFENFTDDVEQGDKSEVLTDDVEQGHKCDHWTDDVGLNKSDMLTDDEQQEDKYDILAYDEEQEDNSVNLTDGVVQDKSDILTDDVEQEDKPDMLTYNVQQEDKSGISTDDVGQENKFDYLSGDVEQEDKSEVLTDDVEQEHKCDNLTDDAGQNKSDVLTDYVQQEDKSDILANDVGQEDKSDIWTDYVEQEDKSVNLTDDVGQDKSDILTDEVEQEDKSDHSTDKIEDGDDDKYYILFDDEEDSYYFDNYTDDIEIEDLNESLFSDDPTDDMPNDVPLPRTKPYLASRIPITRALLVKVLSDIIDGGIP